MTLPDKLSKTQDCNLDISKNKVTLYIYNRDTDKTYKEYKFPKWLAEEILFRIEMAESDGRRAFRSSIKSLLEL